MNEQSNTKTRFIVGHYIQYFTSRDFHVDFTYDNIDDAIASWQHLCSELPVETDVEIHKQVTEVVIARKIDNNTKPFWASGELL